MEQYLRYFCGDAANANALNETEALRVAFYKAVATLARAFADLAQDLTAAGYSDAEATTLQREVGLYTDIRAAIKKHSGEELDIKPYEADMRHLINTYIQADPAAELGEMGEMSLTELIIKTGIHDAIARKLNEKGNLSKNAIAEGIINNVRKTIIREQLTDPTFYAEMSKLLEDLIKQSRADAAAYEDFCERRRRWSNVLPPKSPTPVCPPHCMASGRRPSSITTWSRFRGRCSSTRAWRTTERRSLSGSTGPCVRVPRPAGRATRLARRRC